MPPFFGDSWSWCWIGNSVEKVIVLNHKRSSTLVHHITVQHNHHTIYVHCVVVARLMSLFRSATTCDHISVYCGMYNFRTVLHVWCVRESLCCHITRVVSVDEELSWWLAEIFFYWKLVKKLFFYTHVNFTLWSLIKSLSAIVKH